MWVFWGLGLGDGGLDRMPCHMTICHMSSECEGVCHVVL